VDDALRRHFIHSGVHLILNDPKPWPDLKMLESREICAGALHQRHGRKISARQSLDVATAIAQGRQYFESAKGASHLTKPLLLYYGVLSLARSVIMASDVKGGETSLAEGHGLNAFQWKETLRTTGKTILDLDAEVTRGTFAELAEATKNRERGYSLYHGQYLEPMENLGTENLRADHSSQMLSLSSLIARLPDLTEAYRSTFGCPARAYPTIVYSYGEMQTDYFILNPSGDLPQREVLQERFGWPPSLHLQEQEHHHLLGNIPGLEFRISETTSTAAELEAKFPVKNDRYGFPYLVEPFETGFQLSTLSIMFAITYFAGMLVRYFPSRWAALSSHKDKDKEHSLLIRALDIIEERFPQLALDELYSTPNQEGRYRFW